MRSLLEQGKMVKLNMTTFESTCNISLLNPSPNLLFLMNINLFFFFTMSPPHWGEKGKEKKLKGRN